MEDLVNKKTIEKDKNILIKKDKHSNIIKEFIKCKGQIEAESGAKYTDAEIVGLLLENARRDR